MSLHSLQADAEGLSGLLRRKARRDRQRHAQFRACQGVKSGKRLTWQQWRDRWILDKDSGNRAKRIREGLAPASSKGLNAESGGTCRVTSDLRRRSLAVPSKAITDEMASVHSFCSAMSSSPAISVLYLLQPWSRSGLSRCLLHRIAHFGIIHGTRYCWAATKTPSTSVRMMLCLKMRANTKPSCPASFVTETPVAMF